MSTIQLRLQPAARASSWSTRPRTAPGKQPVMIHSAKFGSIERFIGVLTEHYAGAFPAWLSPVQVIGIPITERPGRLPVRRRRDAAHAAASGSRSTTSDDRMQKKIRTAQKQKVPFMLHRRRDRRRGRRGVVPLPRRVAAQRHPASTRRWTRSSSTVAPSRRTRHPTAETVCLSRATDRADADGVRRRARRVRPAVDAAPDGLHQGREQAGTRRRGRRTARSARRRRARTRTG